MPKQRNFLKQPIQEMESYKVPFPENGTRSEILLWAQKANLHDDKERYRVKEEYKKKLNLLLGEQQDINELDFQTALTIAQASYNGFKVKPSSKKAGAGKKWNDYVLSLLWVEVEHRVKSKIAKTKKEALYSLCRKTPWKEILSNENICNDENVLDLKYDQLRKKYHLAKKTPIIISYNSQDDKYINLDELKSLLIDVVMPRRPTKIKLP